MWVTDVELLKRLIAEVRSAGVSRPEEIERAVSAHATRLEQPSAGRPLFTDRDS
jgi:hypothetical protein